MSRLQRCLDKFGLSDKDRAGIETLMKNGIPEARAVRQYLRALDDEISQLAQRFEGMGLQVARRPQITLDQSEEGARQEDETWAAWKPTATKGGVLHGAPQWVNRTKDKERSLRRMYEGLNNLLQEGVVGRFWYEDSARAVLRLMQGDVVEAEKFIQLLAIYSPQATVQVNTNFAVRAWNQWKNGQPIKVKTGKQDQKASKLLYEGVAFDGRKTNSFYLNLMHDIVVQDPNAIGKLHLDRDLVEAINKPVTIDMWMYRAFGYDNEAAGDDKGTGAYSFAENATRRIAALLNQKLSAGEERWTPHQVQAAIWTAMKARYELPDVKAETYVESLSKGLAFIDDRGVPRPPAEVAKLREHRKIWHKYAMQVESERATKAAEDTSASFSDFLDQLTQTITWEALPSEAVAPDLLQASDAVRDAFTKEARALILNEDGSDQLANLLGAPIAFVSSGAGGYEGNVNPNNLSHIVPTKEAGEFGRAEVQAYARAIQYIFRQEAVPWFRADARALLSKKGVEDQKFRVINTKTGKVVPRSKVDTQAEAEAIAEAKGPGFEVRGGKYARGVAWTFDQSLSPEQTKQVLNLLIGVLGENAGLTRTAPNEISVINYRDDQTGLPFVDDSVWMQAIDQIEDDLHAMGVSDVATFWSEGEYGYQHDWKTDPEGAAILEEGGLAGRPDLQAWVRDRRAALDDLLASYTGEQLRAREQEARSSQVLYQEASPGGDLGAGGAAGARFPVRPDGRIPLTHWGRSEGLTRLDPAFHGQGAAGAERFRQGPDFIPRTYFGMPGYRVTRDPGVLSGATSTYFTTVAPGDLYDLQMDPDGLYDRILARKEATKKYPGLVSTVTNSDMENAIRDAGYRGYMVNNPQLGPVAAVFEVSEVQEVEFTREPLWDDGDVAPFDTRFDHEVVNLDQLLGADEAHAPDRAVQFLSETAQGAREPRRPPSVRDNGDGTYTVLDGRSGTTAALRLGYKRIPVRVIDKLKDGEGIEHRLSDEKAQEVLEGMYQEAARQKDKFDKKVEKIAALLGGRPLTTNLKSRKRTVEKIETDYLGDPTRMKDILRATVELASLDDAQAAYQLIAQEFETVGTDRVTLIGGDPAIDGYVDIKVNVVMDGHVAELQVNVNELLVAKEMFGHTLYETERSLGDGNRDQIMALREAQRNLYGKAAAANRAARKVDQDTLVEQLRSVAEKDVARLNDQYGLSIKLTNASLDTVAPFLRASAELYGAGGSTSNRLALSQSASSATGMPSTSSRTASAGSAASSLASTSDSGMGITSSPTSLSQREGELRGGYQPLSDGNLIQLFQAADLSTFMHEAAHLFLQLELSGQPTEDTARILEWLGAASVDEVLVRPGEAITPEKRAKHELWARTFEAYLFEGKAPSQELRSVFERMADWLTQVYRELGAFLSQHGVKIDDEIRGVFDRMLASDAEIARVEAQGQFAQDLFSNARSAGMTDSEWTAYQQRKHYATRDANESLRTKLLQQLRRRTEKWWKVELAEEVDRVKEDLLDEPVYAAQNFFRGRAAEDHSNRLNTELVKGLFGGEIPRALRGMTHKDSQVSPDDAATRFGFKSGHEMLRTIMGSPTRLERAQELAEEVMMSRHGDILNDGTLEREALEAAHNEERGRLLLHELRILNRRVQRRPIDREALKAAARETIRKIPLKDLRPEKYHRAEVRAAMAAGREAQAGNLEGAYEAKVKQAANFYLWREANEVASKREKIRRYLQGMQKRAYKPGQVHPDYINKLKVYLAAYDFRKSVKEDRAQALARLLRIARWVKDQTTDTRELHVLDPNLEGILAAEQNDDLANFEIKNYRDMTIAELEGVRDMAKHLRYVGGQLADNVAARKAEYHAGVANTLLDNFKDRKAPKKGSTMETFIRGLKGYGANVMLHADAVLRYLDRFKDQGVLYTAIKRPIDDAVTGKLLPMQEQAGNDLAELYAKHYSDQELRAMNRQEEVAGRLMSKWEMIAVALNWGNEGGRKALLDSVSEGQQLFNEVSIDAILNRLDKRDWDFVQSVWDYIATYKEELFELERKRHGLVPPTVEAAPIQTKFGSYRGGYYPLKYDPKESWRVTEEQADEMIKSITLGRFAKAHTRDGMLKERVGSGGRPVWLEMAVLHKHLNEVITMIALSEPVTEVQELLASKPIREAMSATGNMEFLRGLDIWLKDTAAGEIIAGDVMSRVLRHVRTGFSASKLGWNVGTMLMQPLGLLQSMPVIGYGNVWKGVMQLARNPVGPNSVIRQVQAKSKFMHERSSTFNKDIRDTLDKMNGDPNKPGFWPDWMRRSMFAGIVFTQRYVDVATWLGAYEKAKAEMPEGRDADFIHYADRAVARSQASGIWSDRTPVERGSVSNSLRQAEFVRIWTSLASYFFAKGNIAVELTAKTDFADPKQAFKYIVDMLVLFSVEAIMVGLLRGTWPDGDDEDKSQGAWVAKETATALLSTIPFVREFGSEVSGFRGGSTLAQFYKELGDVAKQVDQGELDKALLKAINDVGGIAFKYPSSAINRAGDAAYRDLQGESVDPLEYLIWREKD